MIIANALHPAARFDRYRFDGSDALYVDHLGRRVLADAEGAGSFDLTLVPPDAEIEVDERRWQGEPSFQRSLVIASRTLGLSDVGVHVGGRSPAEEVSRVRLPFRGAGWLIDGASVVLDSKREPAPAGYGGPFFFGIDGAGEADVILDLSARIEPLDRFRLADDAELRRRGFTAQNMSRPRELLSTFGDGAPHGAAVVSHLNAASWQVAVPPGCSGLILRKTYDRFHGRQRARVMVDDNMVGWWYDPRQNRTCRWGVAQFGIGAERLEGREAVRIAIDPPAGSPLWSVSEIEVWSIFS